MTASTAADVVITATGAQSFSTPETRSSCTPSIGTGSGHGGESGLQCAEEPHDVVEALRSQYRDTITDRSGLQEFVRDDLHSLVEL